MSYRIEGLDSNSNVSLPFSHISDRFSAINDKGESKKSRVKLSRILRDLKITKLTVNLLPVKANREVRVNGSEAEADVETDGINFPFSKIVWTVQSNFFPLDPGPDTLLRESYKLIQQIVICILKSSDPTTTPEITNKAGKNTFKFGIYSEYAKQIKGFVRSLEYKYPLIFIPDNSPKKLYQHRAIALVKHILNTDEDARATHEEAHKKILNFLMILISNYNDSEKSDLNSQVKGFTDDLVLWIYTQVQLLETKKGAFERTCLRSTVPVIGKDFDEILEEFKKQAAKPLEVFYNHQINKHSSGYLPHPMFKINHPNGAETTLIYSASITMPENPESINPIYKHCVELLGRKGQKFLHVDLMMHEHEFESTKVIYNDLNKLKNAKVIGLNRVSMLFKSAEQFSQEKCPDMQNWDFFKGVLLNMWFKDGDRENNYCRFPEASMERDILKKDVDSLLEYVKSHYFKEDETLGNNTRRYLQDLAFVELIEHEMMDNGFDYCVISCNSSADRAPSLFTLLELKQILKKHRKVTPEQARELALSLFVNAYIHENRSIHEDRVNDFIEEAYIMIAAGPMPTFTKNKEGITCKPQTVQLAIE